MVCELCKTKHATIHITEMKAGEKRELHLCNDCAQKKGITHKIQLSLTDLLGAASEKGSKALKALKNVKCPNCGITFQDLKNRVRLGCAQDLDVFGEWLGPFIEQVHKSREHAGKLPKSANETQRKENELVKLKRQLDDAVRGEDFEKAALLRDKIKGMGAS
jgi:protein arginine kinase activator